MSLREFVFAIRIEDPGRPGDMVADVAAAIARHAGCTTDSAGELAAAVRRAFDDQHAVGAPCDVHFRAHAGQLHVSVSCERREWRACRPLP